MVGVNDVAGRGANQLDAINWADYEANQSEPALLIIWGQLH